MSNKSNKVVFCQFVLILVAYLLSSSALASTVRLQDLQVTRKAHHWQFSFHLSQSASYRFFTLSKPPRVVLDIPRLQISAKINQALLQASPVKNIRWYHSDKQTRLVLDLTNNAMSDAYAVQDQNGKYQIVVRVLAKHIPQQSHQSAYHKARPKFYTAYSAERSTKRLVQKFLKKHKSASRITRAAKSRHKQVAHNKLRRVIVVIDPGHGGKDPGASGPHGTREKDIVMKIARQLRYYINKQPGFVAKLTRHGDYYVPLRNRLEIARRYRADMFIAIHADAYHKRDAAGASVYALSQRGATSEAARWLATRENESELMGGVNLSDKTNLLKSVLISLSQTASIRASLKIGEKIINAIDDFSNLHHPRVEQAAFVVLKSPDIPSLLVETGFISNPHEERKLRTHHYQRRLAIAIMHGVRSYFKNSPPRGTWLAEQKFDNRI